jgi:hypothetical protein
MDFWIDTLQTLVDLHGAKPQLKIHKFGSDAARTTWINDNLDFDFINNTYLAMQKFSEMLYDAMGDLTESLVGYLPLDFILPSTRVTLRIVDAEGNVPDFRLPNLELDPLDLAVKIDLFGKFYLIYFDLTDVDIKLSDNLYYTINGVYGKGSTHSEDPGHKATISEILVDGLIVGFIIVAMNFLKDAGLQSVASSLIVKGFSARVTLNLKSQLDDVETKVGEIDTNLDTANTKILDILTDTSTIIAKVNEIITDLKSGDFSSIHSKLDEIKSMIGVRMIVS